MFFTAAFGVKTPVVSLKQCKYQSGFASLLFLLAQKSPPDIDNSLKMSGIKILEELEQNLRNLSPSKVAAGPPRVRHEFPGANFALMMEKS